MRLFITSSAALITALSTQCVIGQTVVSTANAKLFDGFTNSDPPMVVSKGSSLAILTAKTSVPAKGQSNSYTECQASGGFGRLRYSSSKTYYGSTLWSGAASCLASTTFTDVLTVTVPGKPIGYPVTYEISTDFQSSEPFDPTYYKDIQVCLTLGTLSECSSVAGPMSITLHTSVGQQIWVGGFLKVVSNGDVTNPVTSINSVKEIKVKLSSPTPGANMKGKSGYIYR